ncbi:hypothetical protein ACU61A_42415 [Pseudonocardia sichuanensis]
MLDGRDQAELAATMRPSPPAMDVSRARVEQLLLVLRMFDLGLALEPLRTTAAEHALLAELAKRRDR